MPSHKFYNYIDECLQEVENGDKKNLGKCNTGIEVLKKLGVEIWVFFIKSAAVVKKSFTSGTTLAGTAKEVLDELSKLHGFSWSVQDNELIAIDDNATISNVITSQNYILSVSRIADKPDQNGIGVNVGLTLSPEFKIGCGFKFKSFLNESLSGTVFKCHKIMHVGDTDKTLFETHLLGYVPGKVYKNKDHNRSKSPNLPPLG